MKLDNAYKQGCKLATKNERNHTVLAKNFYNWSWLLNFLDTKLLAFSFINRGENWLGLHVFPRQLHCPVLFHWMGWNWLDVVFGSCIVRPPCNIQFVEWWFAIGQMEWVCSIWSSQLTSILLHTLSSLHMKTQARLLIVLGNLLLRSCGIRHLGAIVRCIG